MLQSRADIGDQRFEDAGLAMHGRQVQRGLPGVVGRLAHCRQQQRATRDGFHACAGVGSAAVPTPPVVDQRTRACRGLAAVDVLRGEAAHPPLILQLVKAQQLTFKDIAQTLEVSEQTVKRMFVQQDCSLERLEQICELVQLDMRELVRSSPRPRKFIQHLSLAQEEQIARNKKLLMVAVCTLSLWTFEDMRQHLQLSELECADMLHQLDKMGFLDLLAGNRYKLRVARDFSWIIDGPIMRMVKGMAGHYFDHLFDGEGEILKIINVRLSLQSAHKLKARLEQVAQEYADQVPVDAKLPLTERPPLSICIAARRWVPEQLRELLAPLPAK